VDVLIAPRSRRSFNDALALAGLEAPVDEDAAAYGELFLRLLVEGRDFAAVGSPVWLSCVLADAPQDP
jgi:hypothetical protein